MPHSIWSLILPAGIAAALLVPLPAPASGPDQATAFREQGPEALAALLARYDRLPAGAERDRLALTIDKVAGQRYATVSRLYWYTELADAQAAAKRAGKPILSLRMLGRLDEDLSCANSRLFRATLYANSDISKFMRDNFILHWSSERAVPRVTVDFGDGRKLETTTTGNSAHYVLDADGHVLDALPGLYAPVAFKHELTKSLAFAKAVRDSSDDDRAKQIVDYQDKILQETVSLEVPYIAGSRRLLGTAAVKDALAKAQESTMAKAFIEVPMLRWTGHDAGALPDVARWASIGQVLYGIGDLKPGKIGEWDSVHGGKQPPAAKLPRILDDQSRALVTKLHTATMPANPAEIAAMIERLEQMVVADSAQNQLRLRKQVAQQMMQDTRHMTFESLNARIYEHVFHTPRADAWLGLLPRTDFTGVPGDGVVR